jgi:single-strand DNA-binding protein
LQRSYETRDGDNRTSFELQVEDIGPFLRYTVATLPTPARTGSEAASTDHAADDFCADQASDPAGDASWRPIATTAPP